MTGVAPEDGPRPPGVPELRHSRRLEELYLEANDLGAAERDPWLAGLRESDPDMAQQVAALLSAGDKDVESALGSEDPDVPSEQVPVQVGEYKVRSLIAEGAMGAVYDAVQAGTNRHCALKLLRPGLDTPAYRARFQREAAFLGRLNHPGITQVYDAGIAAVEYSDGTRAARRYLAMEFIEGLTALAWAREQQLDIPGRVALVAEAAEAVHHAHQAGLIHRDLKPENIMLTRSGAVKVVDFGIARLLEDAEYTNVRGTVIGTPGYMSPEQLAGLRDRVDTRTDVYALGATLYALVTEHRPVGAEPAPLRAVTPRADRRLEAIVSKAMDRQPERRYASAAELASDLRRWLQGDPILARPARFDFIKHWRRAHPVLARNLVVAAAILTIAAIAIALHPELRLAFRAHVLPTPAHPVRLLHLRTSTTPPELTKLANRLDRLFLSELKAGGIFQPSAGPPLALERIHAASTDLLSPDQLVALRSAGAPEVIAGEFDVADNSPASSVKIRLRLIDTTEGRTISSLAGEASIAEADALVARLCRRLTETVGGPEHTLRSRRNRSEAARRLFQDGVEAWLRFDLIRSRILLERAANHDPASAEVRLALARALQDLGYRDLAVEESLSAQRLANDAVQLADARALHEELRGNWLAGIKTRQGQPPTDARLMALASDLLSTSQFELAARLIAPRSTAAANDARQSRWKLLEARMLRESPGRPGHLSQAQQLVELARRTGPPLFLAEALDKAVEAYTFASMQDASMAALEESRRLFEREGHREGMIRQMATLGQRLQVWGSTAKAIQLLEQAMRLVEGTGFVSSESKVANLLGQAYGRGYDLDLSRRMLSRALALSWNGPRREDSLMLLWRLGIASRDAGQFEDARARFREAMPVFGEMPETEGRVLNSLAETEILAGNADQALEAALRAEKLGILSRADDVLADALTAQSRARVLKGDPSFLNASFEASLAIARKRGMKGSLANGELQWGEALLSVGQARAAASHLRASVAWFGEIDRPAFLGQAHALAAAALAETGDLAGARRHCQAASALAADTKYAYTRTLTHFAEARLAELEGRSRDASALYRMALDDATRYGYAPIAARVRTALSRY